jgi:hypothetical protein
MTTITSPSPTVTPATLAREGAQALLEAAQVLAPSVSSSKSIRPSIGPPMRSRRPWPRALPFARSSPRWSA